MENIIHQSVDFAITNTNGNLNVFLKKGKDWKLSISADIPKDLFEHDKETFFLNLAKLAM